MHLNIEGGVYKAILADFKRDERSGHAISKPELEKRAHKMLWHLHSKFDGARSEKGIAAQRDAFATTIRAARKNWGFTKAAERYATSLLGRKLDGKTGELAKIEKFIRSAIPAAFDTREHLRS